LDVDVVVGMDVSIGVDVGVDVGLGVDVDVGIFFTAAGVWYEIDVGDAVGANIPSVSMVAFGVGAERLESSARVDDVDEVAASAL
jgi:myo-inositol-hexaphosphate 3-phosphohydrolase